MQSIQQNRLFSFFLLLVVITLLVTNGCGYSDKEFEKNGPSKQETRRVLVDVNIISTGEDKVTFEALFYYDISGMVNGKEVSGFDKEIIKVIKPKIGDFELNEVKDANDRVVYSTTIPNIKKKYELTFSPIRNFESLHTILVDPISIKRKIPKLLKSKNYQFELSRNAIGDEFPAIVEITKNDSFLPARIEYSDGKLIIDESSLKPFLIGKHIMRIRFETISNQRETNKSIRHLNYVIKREIEIAK